MSALVFAGKDLIALAQTGSGKTGAFALPILQELLSNRQAEQSFFACVLSPTRSVSFLSQLLSLGATHQYLIWSIRGCYSESWRFRSRSSLRRSDQLLVCVAQW